MIYNGMESKSVFLDNVTGQQIVEEQDRINCSDKMRVKATTILPSMNDGKFYAWVYYDVKAGAVPSMNNLPTPQANNIQQVVNAAYTPPQQHVQQQPIVQPVSQQNVAPIAQPQQQNIPMAMDTSKMV